MTATFTCPHCAASYPRKPVLVGRAVRCTTCKKAFRLRDDGIADPIEMPETAAPSAAPSTSPVPSPTSPSSPSPAPHNTVPSPSPFSSSHDSSHETSELELDLEVVEPSTRYTASAMPGSGSRSGLTSHKDSLTRNDVATQAPNISPPTTTSLNTRSVRLTAQQIEARRAMAASLSTSMSAALEISDDNDSVEGSGLRKATGTGQTATVKKSGTQRHTVRSTRAKTVNPSTTSFGKLAPAVLSNNGDQDARSSRQWLIGCAGVVIIGAALFYLLLHRSDEMQALESFTLLETSQRRQHTDHISALQANAWFVALPPSGLGVMPLQDLGTVRIGKRRSLNLAAIMPVIASVLPRHEPNANHSAWQVIAPPAASSAPKSTEKRSSDSAASTPSKNPVSPPVTIAEFKAALTKASVDAEEQDIIVMILLGRTHEDGRNDLGARLLSGQAPTSIEIAPFSGMNGSILMRGQSKPLRSDYSGILLHFIGDGWPSEWKVLSVKVEKG